MLRSPSSADADDKLTPADPSDLAAVLAYALRYQGRKRVHNADEIMAEIVEGGAVEGVLEHEVAEVVVGARLIGRHQLERAWARLPGELLVLLVAHDDRVGQRWLP